MIEKDVIRERLVDELDCKVSQVDHIVEKINQLDPDIYEGFERWFYKGEISDIEVEGYTVATMMQKRKNMNIVGAFLTLGWLRREPQKAKFALSQIQILRK